ncbi:solute carrier family 49 member A3-like [Haliotis asinina]|uniref:solute carrier family 49 member A3-like n=1 Tax=Haliotis asinina TaxID=109174 RepID=UPI0035317FB1
MAGDTHDPERQSLSTRTITDIHYRPLMQPEYTLYTRRWYIVLVVCVVNMANALIWICFSPITNLTTSYYNITSMQVNWLSLIYLVACIPIGFLATWLLDTVGLRISIILSAWFNLIGCLLRSLTVFDFMPHDARYPVLMTGQLFAACAQPFIMFCPTKLAALWFPDTQRATANTLASMANPIGIMVANLLAPRLVTVPSELPRLLWTCTVVAGLGVVMATFGVCSSVPPTPPTSSAAEASEPFFAGLKKLLRVKSYWVLCFVFGAGLAIFTAFTTFTEQILCPRGYVNSFSGLCGALMIGVGVVGAAVAGIICDKTKRFEEVAKISLAGASLFGIVFTEVSRFRDMNIEIASSIALFGFFGFALYPICMELAVEVTYPVAEATSSGMLFISGQVQGIVYMLVAQMIAQPLPDQEVGLPTGCNTNGSSIGADFTPQDWTIPNLFLNGVAAFVTIVLILLFRPNYRRMRAEELAKPEDPDTRGPSQPLKVYIISTQL